MSTQVNKSSRPKRSDAVSRASTSGISAAENDGFKTAMQSLHLANKEVLKYTSQVHTIERLQEERNELEEELEEYKNKSREQDSLIKHLTAHLTEETATMRDREVDLKRQYDQNKQELLAACAAKLKEAEEEVRNAQTDMIDRENELKIAVDRCKDLQRVLEGSKEELESLKLDIGFPQVDVDIRKHLKSLEEELHGIAKKYCDLPLPESSQCLALFRKLDRSGFLEVLGHAVPISASEESFSLRVATVQAIVTKKLVNVLFRPLFPRSNPLDEKENQLEALLEEFSSKNPRKESILRLVITTMDTTDSTAEKQAKITSIIEQTAKICAPVLKYEGQDKLNKFMEELHNFCDHALRIWGIAQRKENKVIATLHFGNKMDSEDPASPSSQQEDVLDEMESSFSSAPLVLFPRVYQHIAGSVIDLHRGHVLWPDDDLYIEGREQYSNQLKQASIQRAALSNGGARREKENRSQTLRSKQEMLPASLPQIVQDNQMTR